MTIVKGLVLRGSTSMYPELARIEKVSPKTYRVRKLLITPTGEVREGWYSRWWRDACVPVTEAMLKLLQDLASLNELYRQKARALDEEHKEYGKPLVRAIQEERTGHDYPRCPKLGLRFCSVECHEALHRPKRFFRVVT